MIQYIDNLKFSCGSLKKVFHGNSILLSLMTNYYSNKIVLKQYLIPMVCLIIINDIRIYRRFNVALNYLINNNFRHVFFTFYISFMCCMTTHHWSNFRSIRTTKCIIIEFRSIKYIDMKWENKNQFFFDLTQIFKWIYRDTFVCVYM